MATNDEPQGWQRIGRQRSLFRRFEFAAYAETRLFLERLAALSERTGIYPDLSFGTKHVNVTVHGASGEPGEAEVAFALEVARLARPDEQP
ncbi:MAG: 4a-hydroxytetrahydrobiopterin dehydratase [Geminicoccaceae bacterium]|nr:4a-hydroxytetrahydrobiopterin dehydratase [Geminicoccaceae bacterium]MCS7267167.1 4a-hydroxytetrahydrobiopterin dehydratase [Geminicoccaceae bacterium]MCX7630611.1 4a-hydroxytetrahydrobiopterin dehydratase [Geminicoccaceae bacterium]MDW8124052.1 4a-hydroxytetrahydrobiopterin dehydratase [Geminicoccaceae bacterium]MDW8341258.1 4a-hydroxytetrahydrobiopterin dehydratase [Geminicoccaceae bacterium]